MDQSMLLSRLRALALWLAFPFLVSSVTPADPAEAVSFPCPVKDRAGKASAIAKEDCPNALVDSNNDGRTDDADDALEDRSPGAVLQAHGGTCEIVLRLPRSLPPTADRVFTLQQLIPPTSVYGSIRVIKGASPVLETDQTNQATLATSEFLNGELRLQVAGIRPGPVTLEFAAAAQGGSRDTVRLNVIGTTMLRGTDDEMSPAMPVGIIPLYQPRPEVLITSPSSGNADVLPGNAPYSGYVLIAGYVGDILALTSEAPEEMAPAVTVNGRSVDVYYLGGQWFFFAHTVEVQTGRNSVRVIAENALGTRGFDTLHIDVSAEPAEQTDGTAIVARSDAAATVPDTSTTVTTAMTATGRFPAAGTTATAGLRTMPADSLIPCLLSTAGDRATSLWRLVRAQKDIGSDTRTCLSRRQSCKTLAARQRRLMESCRGVPAPHSSRHLRELGADLERAVSLAADALASDDGILAINHQDEVCRTLRTLIARRAIEPLPDPGEVHSPGAMAACRELLQTIATLQHRQALLRRATEAAGERPPARPLVAQQEELAETLYWLGATAPAQHPTIAQPLQSAWMLMLSAAQDMEAAGQCGVLQQSLSVEALKDAQEAVSRLIAETEQTVRHRMATALRRSRGSDRPSHRGAVQAKAIEADEPSLANTPPQTVPEPQSESPGNTTEPLPPPVRLKGFVTHINGSTTHPTFVGRIQIADSQHAQETMDVELVARNSVGDVIRQITVRLTREEPGVFRSPEVVITEQWTLEQGVEESEGLPGGTRILGIPPRGWVDVFRTDTKTGARRFPTSGVRIVHDDTDMIQTEEEASLRLEHSNMESFTPTAGSAGSVPADAVFHSTDAGTVVRWSLGFGPNVLDLRCRDREGNVFDVRREVFRRRSGVFPDLLEDVCLRVPERPVVITEDSRFWPHWEDVAVIQFPESASHEAIARICFRNQLRLLALHSDARTAYVESNDGLSARRIAAQLEQAEDACLLGKGSALEGVGAIGWGLAAGGTRGLGTFWLGEVNGAGVLAIGTARLVAEPVLLLTDLGVGMVVPCDTDFSQNYQPLSLTGGYIAAGKTPVDMFKDMGLHVIHTPTRVWDAGVTAGEEGDSSALGEETFNVIMLALPLKGVQLPKVGDVGQVSAQILSRSGFRSVTGEMGEIGTVIGASAGGFSEGVVPVLGPGGAIAIPVARNPAGLIATRLLPATALVVEGVTDVAAPVAAAAAKRTALAVFAVGGQSLGAEPELPQFAGTGRSEVRFPEAEEGPNGTAPSGTADPAPSIPDGGTAEPTGTQAGQPVSSDSLAGKLPPDTVSGVLSPEVRRLAEKHITDSGIAVLGHWEPKTGGYLAKARALGASHFDIGSAWHTISTEERIAANLHFLDIIAQRCDDVLLSVHRTKIRYPSMLADEIRYLTQVKGYRWVDGWCLRKGQ